MADTGSERRRQRDALRGITRLGRLQRCAITPTGRADGSTQKCGSVWSCPVCSAKIRHERAQELEHALGRWMELYPAGSALLLTLTIPHDRGEALDGLMDTIRHAWTRLTSGGAWTRDKASYGVQHYVRAWDSTHGGNGWHPHLHALLFLDREPAEGELEQLESRLHGRWARACTERGHREPSREHGTHMLRIDKSSAAANLMAWGAWSACTGATTIAGIWAQVAARDARSRFLAREWEQATHGRQWMRWSHGLKETTRVVGNP